MALRFAFRASVACLAAGLLLAPASVTWAEEWLVEGKLVGKEDKKADDLSGIGCASPSGFPRDCLVIDDETQFAQWVTLEQGRIVAGELLPLIDDVFGGEPVELDGEAAAYGDGSFFVIGSFGAPRNNPAQDPESAARLKADSHAFRITPTAHGPSITESNALRALLLSDPDLGRFADMRLDENGLTIEGMAILGEIAYIGLRGPVLANKDRAAIVELPIAVLFGDDAGVSKVHTIPLGPGRGVRDLTAVGDRILVLAGPGKDDPEADAAAGAYRLLQWDPKSTNEPAPLLELPFFTHGDDAKPDKPEAVLPLQTVGGKLDVLILSDGPNEGAPRPYSVDWAQ